MRQKTKGSTNISKGSISHIDFFNIYGHIFLFIPTIYKAIEQKIMKNGLCNHLFNKK